MSKPIPPPTPPPPPIDRDGYPKLCEVCGKPVLLKQAAVFVTEVHVPSGRVVRKETRHINCVQEGTNE
jgi:hypothetical protein